MTLSTDSETQSPAPGPARLRSHARSWTAQLFRDARPERPAAWKMAAGLLVLAAGTTVSIIRQPGIGALDTMWAEDGSIFVMDAVNKPFLDNVLTAYNGYYQVLPRLLAEPVQYLPAAWAAAYVALSAALVTAVFGLVVYVASAQLLPNQLARTVAAAMAVIVPVGMGELPNSLANIHWAGLYAMFWIFLWVPGSRTGRVVGSVVTLTVAATNILAVVFVPLALLRWTVRRDWHGRVLAGLLGVGVGLHLVGLAIGASSRAVGMALLDPLRQLLTWVLPNGLFGDVVYGFAADRAASRWALALAAVAVVAAAVLVAALGLTRPNWPVFALAWLHAAAFWLVAAGTTGMPTVRYVATPAMLMVAGLVALLLPRAGARGHAPVVVFAVFVMAIGLINLRVDNARATGPGWRDSLEVVQTECRQTAPDSAVLPISPGGLWFTRLPCGYLLR